MQKFLKDNSLSLAFLGLFAICLAGQVLTGYALQFEDPAGQSHSPNRLAYLSDPSFLKGIFSNWQAALLQLFTLIVLSVYLRQRGASHSRKTEGELAEVAHARHLHWFGRSRSWAYANSLSLAFLGLFAVTFAVFFVVNTSVNNAQRARFGEPALDLTHSLVSADLWFQTFQTWQAEFFAMGVFLILSVFLRQDGSAESKPVNATDDETGETNE